MDNNKGSSLIRILGFCHAIKVRSSFLHRFEQVVYFLAPFLSSNFSWVPNTSIDYFLRLHFSIDCLHFNIHFRTTDVSLDVSLLIFCN